MIFYFTATGNCLYAARELAAEGEAVRSIPQELRRAGELSYADDAIGVIYPIYGHMMPAMVRDFVERATCARVCSARCIRVADGVAVRDAAAGDGCNACLACVHACPARAIELPMGEKNPEARFRNEHVSLADLVAANG